MPISVSFCPGRVPLSSAGQLPQGRGPRNFVAPGPVAFFRATAARNLSLPVQVAATHARLEPVRGLLYDRLSGSRLYRRPSKLYGHSARLNGVSSLITSTNFTRAAQFRRKNWSRTRHVAARLPSTDSQLRPPRTGWRRPSLRSRFAFVRCLKGSCSTAMP